MQKVFIADHSEEFTLVLAGALRADYLVGCCGEGTEALKQIRSFHPDVLILDLMVPGTPGMDILKAVREESLCPVVIVTSAFFSDYVMDALQRYHVDYVARKPCLIQAITDRVSELLEGKAAELVREPDIHSALSSILLALNMPTNRKGFRYCRDAVLMLSRDPGLQVTKMVYPTIAKQYNASSQAVEKAIRGAIESAWDHRSDPIWRQYFPTANGQIPRPTNAQFLTRLADVLSMSRSRMA